MNQQVVVRREFPGKRGRHDLLLTTYWIQWLILIQRKQLAGHSLLARKSTGEWWATVVVVSCLWLLNECFGKSLPVGYERGTITGTINSVVGDSCPFYIEWWLGEEGAVSVGGDHRCQLALANRLTVRRRMSGDFSDWYRWKLLLPPLIFCQHQFFADWFES